MRRSSSNDFSSPVTIATTQNTLFTHINAALDPGLHTYRVFSVNACGTEQ